MSLFDDLPRGIRNNNPGNIRLGIEWDGLAAAQTDKDFCQFSHLIMGLRAAGIVLRTYQIVHGLHSVKGIIDRWAPPVENDTASYIAHVEGCVSGGPLHQQKRLLEAIIIHENGPGWVGYALVEAVIEAVWKGQKVPDLMISGI